MSILNQYQKNYNKSDQRTLDKNAGKGIMRGKSAGPSKKMGTKLTVSGNNNRK